MCVSVRGSRGEWRSAHCTVVVPGFWSGPSSLEADQTPPPRCCPPPAPHNSRLERKPPMPGLLGASAGPQESSCDECEFERDEIIEETNPDGSAWWCVLG